MKKLNELFTTENEMAVYSIHSDSRYVLPHSIFFCIEGLTVDGHQYVEDAIFQGAKCIVHSRELDNYHPKIQYIKVSNTLNELNRVADLFYDSPSSKMKVIGVTGTSGKTVVASFIHQVLNEYCKAGYIGTLSLMYNNAQIETPYTTPETVFLQKHLFQMAKSDVKVVALEASSYGLALGRIDGVDFDIAVVTNIGDEHLEFHGTKEQYVACKQKLFEKVGPNQYAVINNDDHFARKMKEVTKAKCISYGMNEKSDIMATDVLLSLEETIFNLYIGDQINRIRTPLLGIHNVYNLLAVAATLKAVGSDNEMICQSLQKNFQVQGRYEPYTSYYGAKVIVDYCHTLQNYKDIFQFVDKTKNPSARVFVVLGLPSKREIRNREKIGELANYYVDHVIITRSDERGESLQAIGAMIQKPIVDIPSIIIEDRQIAIEQALQLASKDDIVMVLGKGHEDFMALETGKVAYLGDGTIVENIIKYEGELENELQWND
ncbi:UDP-N-acetylmuramoyl-L-alanyl-D-glutamate--2,6-diaminopimelate ligase [Tannockella kyphosi]|uniref:UDP-N-acetylmuramoyl-L-alanyl-D-glutamate--2, 6-diaminopimelate ligase n=1 Tax=Tannockella kyphosi TaxID=2899121 RepID=UPI002011FD05|nr:UDP-N-acetylmuramoyl-L-alanyl-D-glutamate--2,6-diaminopimelate ligase [Tannockella kyphosi]